jgi:hypothetical protein
MRLEQPRQRNGDRRARAPDVEHLRRGTEIDSHGFEVHAFRAHAAEPGRAREEIERTELTRRRPREQDTAAEGARQRQLADERGQRRGDRRVDRTAAQQQRLRAGRRRLRISSGNDAACLAHAADHSAPPGGKARPRIDSRGGSALCVRSRMPRSGRVLGR